MGEETSDLANGFSKYAAEIKALTGFDIMVEGSTDKFKDIYDIFDGIAKVWDKLSDTQRSRVSEILGGTRQLQVISSIIGNWKDATGAYETAMNSVGAATRANDIYMSTAEAHINQFKAAFQNMSQTVVNSDLVKFFVDFGTAIMNVISKIASIPTLIAGIAAALSFKNMGFFKTFTNENGMKELQFLSTGVRNAWQAMFSKNNPPTTFSLGEGFAEGLQKDQTAIENYTKAVEKAVKEGTSSRQDAFDTYMVNASHAAQAYANSLDITSLSAANANNLTEEFAKTQRLQAITTNAQDRSLANVRAQIEEYNTGIEDASKYTKNAGVSTKEFAQSVKQGNTALGRYLEKVEEYNSTVAEGGEMQKASMFRYMWDRAKAGIANIGMSALSMAGNMLLSMGVSAIVSSLVQLIGGAISEAMKSTEQKLAELKSEYQNITGDIQKQASSYQNLRQSMETLIPEYAKLSQGVDRFGNNLSLSEEDYARWIQMNNQVAQAFPELNLGMDSNGNAIISIRSGIDETTESLWKMVEAARALTNENISGTMPELFENVAKQAQLEEESFKGYKDQLNDLREAIKRFKETGELGLSPFNESGTWDENSIGAQIATRLEAAGYSFTGNQTPNGSSAGDWLLDMSGMSAQDKAKLSNLLDEYLEAYDAVVKTKEDKVRDIWNSVAPSVSSWLETDTTYQNLDALQQKLAQSFVHGLDYADLAEQQIDTATEIESYIQNNIIDKIKQMTPETSQALYEAMSPPDKGVSLKDYMSQVKGALNQAAAESGIDYEKLLDLTGLGETLTTYSNQAQELADSLADVSLDQALEMTPGEIQKAFALAKEYGMNSLEDIRAAIESQTFEIKVDLTVESEGLAKVRTALNEAASATGLSSDSIEELKKRYKDLKDFDPAKLFEMTANGVHVNAKAMQELESQIEKVNKQKLQDQLKEQTAAYDELTKRMEAALRYGNGDFGALSTQRDNVAEKIAETQQLISMYHGLTSAYNEWVQAQSQSKERTPYENIGKQYDSLKKVLESGFINDPELEKYLDLIYGEGSRTGDNVADFNRLTEAIEGTKYSIRDFFKFDEDGNLTSEGLRNYLMAAHDVMKELGDDYVKLDEATGEPISFNFDGEKMDELAKKLGISTEMMQLFHRALAEAGFDVELDMSFLEGDYANIEKTAGDALSVLQRLKEAGEISGDLDLKINLDVSSVEEAEAEVKKARDLINEFRDESGNVDLSRNGAIDATAVYTQALYSLEALKNAAVLTIQVDTSMLDTELGQAAQKVKEFGEAKVEFEVALKENKDGIVSDSVVEAARQKLEEAYSGLKEVDIDLSQFNINTESLSTAIQSVGADAAKAIQGELDAALEEKNITVNYESNYDEIEQQNSELDGKSLSVTVTYSVQDNGVVAFNAMLEGMTHNFNVNSGGSHPGAPGVYKPGYYAKAGGDPGATRSGWALGGELGRELVVRDGRFFTIGDNGAEMFNFKKGDIIFDAEQTKQILERGRITSGKKRGFAFAQGAAFDSGSGGFHGTWVGVKPGNSGDTPIYTNGDVEVENDIHATGDIKIDSMHASVEGARPTVEIQDHGDTGMNGSVSGGGHGGSGGSGGNSGKDKEQTWFEKQYNYHNHLVNMEKESYEAYLAWLEKAYQKAYKEHIIDLDEYYKYEEEVYEGRKKLFEDYLNDLQHKIDMMEHKRAQNRNIDQIIAYYQRMMAAVHQEAEAARARGLTDEDEYIQELQQKWWEYYEAIADSRSKWFNDILNDQKFKIDNMAYIDTDSTKLIQQWRTVMGSIEKELRWYLNHGYKWTDDVVQDLIKELQGARDEIISIANDAVDGLQNVYKTFTDAAKEWATTGFLSVDSLQSILELGPKYLQFLYDENGQLKLNEQTLQKVLAAKTQEMAVENALAYVKQILAAAENKDVQSLIALTEVSSGATASTWSLVYATLGLAKSIGVANGISEEYFDNALDYVNKIQALSETAISTISAYYETLNDSYISQADALDKIIDYTKDLLKWENEQQIQALKDQIEAYKKIIEAKKESLRLSKEQDDHDKSVAEQLEEIAKLQARIDLLSMDDSREARAERSKLEEQLLDKQKALADDQADYAYDKQTEALDKEFEAFEEEKNAEIKVLEEMYSSEEKLFQAAIDRIQNGWADLYQQLIAWNTEYGNSLNKEITAAWKSAADAVERFGDFLGALIGTDSHVDLGPSTHSSSVGNQMHENSLQWLIADAAGQAQLHAANEKIAEDWYQKTGDKLSYSNGSWYHSSGELLYSISKEEMIRTIVNAMKKNSAEWRTADADRKAYLDQMNLILGARLEKIIGRTVRRDDKGVWWLENKRLYDVYHHGGIVGNNGTLKQNEVMAVLEKGEAVLDAKRESGLYKMIDFVQTLSDKLGKAINPDNLRNVFAGLQPIPAVGPRNPSVSGIENFVFNPSIQVSISHNGDMSDAAAKRYGETIADATLGRLSEAFAKRGIGKIGNAMLKQ